MHKSKKRESKSIYYLLVGTILFFMNNHILSISIPLSINNLGWNLEIVGYCTTGMGLMTIVMKLVTPQLLRKIKLKYIVLTTILLLASISFSFILSSRPLTLILLRSVYGLPFSLFPVINLLIVTKVSNTNEELVKNTSTIGMAMPISMVISPIMTEKILSYFSYKVVFFLSSIVALLCLTVYTYGIKEIEETEVESVNKQNTKKTPTNYISILIAFFFLGIVDILILTYFPLIAETSMHSYSFFFTLFAFSMVICQKLYPKIKLSSTKKLVVGYILLGISVLCAGITEKAFYAFSILSALSFGIGYSLSETATNTLIMKEKSPSLINLQQLTVSLGRTLGPLLISVFSKDTNQLNKCFIYVSISMFIPILLTIKPRKNQ